MVAIRAGKGPELAVHIVDMPDYVVFPADAVQAGGSLRGTYHAHEPEVRPLLTGEDAVAAFPDLVVTDEGLTVGVDLGDVKGRAGRRCSG